MKPNYIFNEVNLPFEPELKAIMNSCCQVCTVEADTILAEEGKYMKVIPLLLDGLIRVFRQDYDLDREILLYYIDSGQTCMMSLVASFRDMKSQVHAITERKSEMLLIPTAKVREWQVSYASWNNFVIDTFLNRYTELLTALNELSFKNTEERLIAYFKQYKKREKSDIVSLTHQDLAKDLGTNRVVISRLLKKIEKDGFIKLGRGYIELINL